MKPQRRRMLGLLAGGGLLAITGGGRGISADPLAELARLTAARLALMPDVARHKYNTGGAVEDLPREAQVLATVTAQAAAAGVERGLAERFFQAQIDAAKQMQQTRIDQWIRAGQEKFSGAPDLATAIRPRLDELTPQIIGALRAAAGEIARPDTLIRLEKLAVDYAAAHNSEDAAAFRRALAPLSAP